MSGIKKAVKGIGKVAKGILSGGLGLVGGLSGGILGGLLGKKPKVDEEEAPVAPVVEPPPLMPIPDDEEAQKARRRSIAAQISRRGRQSTILTQRDIGDSLG